MSWRRCHAGTAHAVHVCPGRRAGIRPGDLVGAIANESGIDARAIGAIDIADGYSLVEVDEMVAERVVGALSRAWLKGQKVEVGLEPDDGSMPSARPPNREAPPRRGPPRTGRPFKAKRK